MTEFKTAYKRERIEWAGLFVSIIGLILCAFAALLTLAVSVLGLLSGNAALCSSSLLITAMIVWTAWKILPLRAEIFVPDFSFKSAQERM